MICTCFWAGFPLWIGVRLLRTCMVVPSLRIAGGLARKVVQSLFLGQTDNAGGLSHLVGTFPQGTELRSHQVAQLHYTVLGQ